MLLASANFSPVFPVRFVLSLPAISTSDNWLMYFGALVSTSPSAIRLALTKPGIHRKRKTLTLLFFLNENGVAKLLYLFFY